jgi:hypothetical protein
MEKSTLPKLNLTIKDIYRWKTYFQLTFAFDINFPKFKKIFTVIITKHRNMLIIDYYMAIFISHVISTGDT